MQLKLGQNVCSSDGADVGHVSGFMLDFSTRHVERVIVRAGVSLIHDRLVARAQVSAVQPDETIILSIPVAEVLKLPEFLNEEFAAATPEDFGGVPNELGGGFGAPSGDFGDRDEPFGYRGGDPFFVSGPVVPPQIEIESSVPERDIVLKSGTTVIARDGKTLGRVEKLGYGSDGEIEEIVVKTGHLRHHELTVPNRSIDTVGSNHIRLNITTDEMRRSHSST